jgi:Holliday junction resolvasome RuvABC ATP-dependent DNA helicase subunit
MDEQERQVSFPFLIEPARVFTPTAPIDERSLFAGRTDQIRSVIRAVTQKGQHAIVYGERGVGKTSLANVLSSFLQSPDYNVLSPRVNCNSMDTFELVWKKVLDEIKMYRKMQPAGFAATLEQDISKSSADLLGPEVTPDSVRRALTVLSQNSLPILIIDEFDRLTPDVKRGIADTVKTLSDHAVAATVVLVGVADSVGDLIEEHESVERALIQVPMPRMSSGEIRQIIRIGMQKLGLSVAESVVQRICALAQGLPHYAHLLGLETAAIARERQVDTIDTVILECAITQSIQNSQQSIIKAWHLATMSPRRDNLFSDVLLACAMAHTDDLGYFAAQDIKEPLRQILNRKVEIANYAQHLSEFSDEKRGPVLQRIGGKRRFRFRFTNPLMQPYVVMQGFASHKITDEMISRASS